MTGQAVNSALRIYIISIHISISDYIFGYTIGVFNTCQDNVAYTMGWSSSEQAFYLTVFSTFIPVGAFFGSFFTGFACNKYGRLGGMAIMNFVVLMGSILSSIPITGVFGVGRLICGFGVGMCLAIAPTYLSELTPQEYMGRVGPIMSLMLYLGLTTSYSFALILPNNHFSESINDFWIIMFIFPGIIAIYQFIYFIFILKYDSPIYYLRTKQFNKYKDVLSFIYSNPDIPNDEDLNTKAENIEGLSENIDLKDLICSKTYSKMFRIGFILASLQQISGVNAIISYSFSIYTGMGLNSQESKIFTVFIGVTALITSFLMIFILNHIGRKTLLLVGFFGISVILMLMGLISQFAPEQTYLLAGLVLVYFIFFAGSLQAVLWSYIGEIQNEKAIGISAAGNYFVNVIVNLIFPIVANSLGIYYTFYFFCIWMILGGIYIGLDTFETKAKSKEEIELKLFGKNTYSITSPNDNE